MKLFKVGDFIRNKNPYEGEIKDNYYMCVGMKGKHSKEPSFNMREGLHVEYTDSYEKVYAQYAV